MLSSTVCKMSAKKGAAGADKVQFGVNKVLAPNFLTVFYVIFPKSHLNVFLSVLSVILVFQVRLPAQNLVFSCKY